MKVKEKLLNVLILMSVSGIFLALVLCTYGILTMKTDESLPVSFPEEIDSVKTGDTLIVNKVSDSIYIGFK